MGSLFEIGISVAWYSVFALFIWFSPIFRLNGYPTYVSVLLFTLKVLAGVLITYIYSSVYNDRFNSDLFKLYDDSRHLYDALPEKPLDYLQMLSGYNSDNPYFDRYYYKMYNWFPYYENTVHHDTRTMIRLNAFFRLFSFNVFQVHNIFMSFLSFSGLVLLYKTFYNYFIDRKSALLFSLFLIPSVVFWSSGMLKEGFIFFALGVFLYGAWPIVLYTTFSVKSLIYCLVGVLLFLMIKVYVLLAFLPGLILYIIAKRLKVKNWTRFYIITSGVLLLILVLSPYIIGKYSPLYFLSNRQNDMLRLVYYVNPGSGVDMQPMAPDGLSFLRVLPEAYFNTLFRPTIVESKGMLQLASAFENGFLMILFIFWLGLVSRRNLNTQVFWIFIFFCFTLFAIMGITTPILGTLNRYRIPAMPFLLMAIFLSIDFQRFKSIIRQLFKL